MGEHSHKPTAAAAETEVSAPAVLEELVQRADAAGASDIHLQTQSGGAAVSFRLDGVMVPAGTLNPSVAERVFGRIKFLARLKTYQESLPQDGRIERAALGTRNDIRVATYPTVSGEKVVLRLFSSGGVKTVADLDMPVEIVQQLEWFLKQSTGMLLLTGPAGSGKTTTIYACLQRLSEPGGRHVITVEDPAEQIVPGIMQTEVNEALGLTFARAARHLLRQDPQVLVIGEIRDEETAEIAVRAALTGHLLISTLHAGSCKGVFARLATLCHETTAMVSSLELVLNQRLVRKLCVGCAGAGCADCLGTGFRGRLPLVESLRVTDDIRRQFAKGDLASIPVSPSLADRGRMLVEGGLTTPAEVARVLGT